MSALTKSATALQSEPTQAGPDSIADLSAQRDEFVKRLNGGFKRIEEARSTGVGVEGWERFWMELLQQYEAICDRLAELQSADDLRLAG